MVFVFCYCKPDNFIFFFQTKLAIQLKINPQQHHIIMRQNLVLMETSALTQCDLGNTENSAFLPKNENNN